MQDEEVRILEEFKVVVFLLLFVRNTRLEGSAIDARKVRSVWRWTIRKDAPSASVSGGRLLAGRLALVGGNGDCRVHEPFTSTTPSTR